MSLKALDDRLKAVEDQQAAYKSIDQLTERASTDGTEYIPVHLPADGGEYKMLASTFHSLGFRTITADGNVLSTDINGVIVINGNNITLTIPNDLGWNNGRKLLVIVYGTGFTLASGGSVTINNPQSFVDTDKSTYEITKTSANTYSAVQQGVATGGGSSSWGNITGSLSSQTDLQTALDAKIESVVGGTNVTIDNTDPENPIINASTGVTAYSRQTVITTATSTFNATQIGFDKVYPFNSASSQEVTINLDGASITAGQGGVIERKDSPSLEIKMGTNTRFRGPRNQDGDYFVLDSNTVSFWEYIGDDSHGNKLVKIGGNIARGDNGAVTTTTYGSLGPTETKNVTVTGTNFTDDMFVAVSAGNCTLNSWAYVSSTEITLNLTGTGSDSDQVSFYYDNGDPFTDTNALTLTTSVTYLYDSYPFEVAFSPLKLRSSITTPFNVRRGSDDAYTDVNFDSNQSVALTNTVSATGTLTAWATTDDVFIGTYYNQGSFGSGYNVTQGTNANQPKFLNGGALIQHSSQTMIEFDGTNDELTCSTSYAWANGDLTIFAYVRLDVDQNCTIISGYGSSGDRTFTARYKSADNRFELQVVDGAGTTRIAFTDLATINMDQNYMVVFRKSGLDLSVEIDGDVGATVTMPSQTTDTTQLRMGASLLGSPYLDGWNGSVVMYTSDEWANRTSITPFLTE